LAFGEDPLEESQGWMDMLNDNVAFNRLEKDALKISQTCKRARDLLQTLERDDLPATIILEVVNEILALDREAANWRKGPQWSFTTMAVSDLANFSGPKPPADYVQLHTDVWTAYEWNYHRTARIVAHQQLLKCLESAMRDPHLDVATADSLQIMSRKSIATINALADEVLSTVPQSLADINHLGIPHDAKTGSPRCRAIGAYLLLWPIKIIKGSTFATWPKQKEAAQAVFERLRDHTGMKSSLGDLSLV
jgi:hypothetical protein